MNLVKKKKNLLKQMENFFLVSLKRNLKNNYTLHSWIKWYSFWIGMKWWLFLPEIILPCPRGWLAQEESITLSTTTLSRVLLIIIFCLMNETCQRSPTLLLGVTFRGNLKTWKMMVVDLVAFNFSGKEVAPIHHAWIQDTSKMCLSNVIQIIRVDG